MKLTNKLNLSENMFLYVVSGLVIVLLVALSAVRIRQYQQTVELINIESRALEAKQNRLSSLKALEKIRDELVFAFSHLEGKIPHEPNEQELIAYIEQQAGHFGAALVQLRLNDQMNKNNITEQPMTFTLKGSYSSLVNMLKNLSSGERLIRIDAVRIVKDENNPGNTQADITAAAFFDSNVK